MRYSRSILILTAILLYSLQLAAQSDWQWLNPVPTGSNFRSVYFTDDLTGYFAGDCGSLLKTTDGGNTWQFLNSGTHNHITGICFISENEGFAVGSQGTLITTTDAGSHWIPIALNTNISLTGIMFPDKNHGYITGDSGIIVKTSDGGKNWNKFHLAGTVLRLNALNFITADTGFIVADSGRVMRTFNGGTSWNIKALASTDLYSVCFVNKQKGFIGTTGGLFMTIDCGETWTCTNPATGTAIRSIAFANQSDGFFSAMGLIVRTTDGGSSWDPSVNYLPDEYVLYSISCPSGSTAYAAGLHGGIIRSTDLGKHWQRLGNGFLNDIRDIDFAGPNTGYITSQGLLKTNDSGKTWESVHDSYSFYAAFFISPDTGYIAFEGTVDKTFDGGVSLYPCTGQNAFRDIFFPNRDTGFAVGGLGTGPGLIVKTYDRGLSWSYKFLGTYGEFHSVHFPASKLGFAAGGYNFTNNQHKHFYSGLIYRTADGGKSWQKVFDQPDFLRSVFFPSSETGYAAGDSGKIWKSVDSGLHWNLCPDAGCRNTLYSLCFLSNDTGYVSGEKGLLLKTVNGGTTWAQENIGTDNDLLSLYLNPANNLLYVAGGFGTILMKGNQPTGYQEKNPPMNTELKVFPNPFTGSATIMLQAPGGQPFKLVIFTLTGQELFEQTMMTSQTGTTPVRISGMSIPKGIIFCRIILNDRVYTVKLIRM